RPEVREAMLERLGPPANPSSAHREGARARAMVEEGRALVAALIGAEPAEIVFASGATEANNPALRGGLARRPGARPGTTPLEHSSVLETARALAAGGAPVTLVGADAEGGVAAAEVLDAVRADTALVSVGLANGEVGSLGPVAEVAAGLRGRGVPVHSD